MTASARAFGLLICILFTAGAALAQEGEGASATGPVKLSLNVSAEYTDNRDASKVEESNVDIYVKPRVGILVERDGSELDLSYEPIFRHRTDPGDTQDDNELYHNFRLKTECSATRRLKFRLDDKFVLTDDPSFQDGGTILQRDSSYIYNKVNVGMLREFDKRTNIDISGRHSTKQYDDDERGRESDETRYGGTLSIWRQVQRTVALSVEGDVGWTEYPESSGLDRAFSTVNGRLGLDKQLSQQLRGFMRLGWTAADYEDDEIDSESSPYVLVGLKGSTVPSFRVTTTVSHEIRDSDVFPFASQEETAVGGGIEFDCTPDLTLSVSAGYRMGDYDDNVAPSAATTNDFYDATSGDEDTLTAAASIRYKIDDDTAISLVQSYEDVDSDVDVSFTRNATRMALSRKF